jgi:hypothetical protein
VLMLNCLNLAQWDTQLSLALRMKVSTSPLSHSPPLLSPPFYLNTSHPPSLYTGAPSEANFECDNTTHPVFGIYPASSPWVTTVSGTTAMPSDEGFVTGNAYPPISTKMFKLYLFIYLLFLFNNFTYML